MVVFYLYKLCWQKTCGESEKRRYRTPSAARLLDNCPRRNLFDENQFKTTTLLQGQLAQGKHVVEKHDSYIHVCCVGGCFWWAMGQNLCKHVCSQCQNCKHTLQCRQFRLLFRVCSTDTKQWSDNTNRKRTTYKCATKTHQQFLSNAHMKSME